MIPIGTDQYSWRTPLATMVLVAVNAVAYTAMLVYSRGSDAAVKLEVMQQQWGLSWQHFRWWQPVTYQFVHDHNSIWHIVGNMIFLWVFGTSVEARFRWWGFVLFYLAGGALAGMIEILWHDGALVVGASGAVLGVTGAFITLYPRARVSVFLLLSVLPVPAMLLVSLYLALDLFGVMRNAGDVAYMAHLAGFAYGVAVAMSLLALGVIKRTDMDLLYLIKQSRRRAEMRRVAAAGATGGPWRADAGKSAAGTAGGAGAAGATARGDSTASAQVGGPRVAARYVDLGNSAFSKGDFPAAAEAYERALAAAPEARDVDHTRLMLAVIYGRKLNQPARARQFLHEIKAELPDQLRDLRAALQVEVQG